MAKPAARYPSTKTEFEKQFPDRARHTIHSLPPDLRSASGSNWNLNHLRACRVLFKSCSVPPALKSHTSAASRKVDESTMPLRSLTKLSADKISKMCHRELRLAGEDFGPFYVALSDVMCPPEPSTSIRSTRIRRQAAQSSEFVTGQGFSSPPTAESRRHGDILSSSSSFQPSSQGEEDFEAQLDRAKHEAVSADLAAQFISSVLDLFLAEPEPTAVRTKRRIEFSREPTKFYLKSSVFSCACEDDGSIIWRKVNPFTTKWPSNRTFLCSLEAKARYTQADAQSGNPTVSGRVLAQIACELLGAIMAANSERDDSESFEERRLVHIFSLLDIYSIIDPSQPFLDLDPPAKHGLPGSRFFRRVY